MSPRQPIKSSDLDNLSHMKHGGLLNKHLCKKKIKAVFSEENYVPQPSAFVGYIKNYFRGVRKGYNTAEVGFESLTSRSRVRYHSPHG